MSSFKDLLAGKLAEEASENAMRDILEKEMKRAADRGEAGKDIAKSGLKSIFGDASPVMQIARGLKGFVPKAAYPIVATVGATAIAKWAEDLLPGDTRSGVKEAKFILKYVAPHLVIGAAEAFGEVSSQIDQQVDAVRSDSTIPDALRNKSLDMVVEADLFPDRIFIPARKSDGEIQINSDGTPLVLDRDYAIAQRLWDQTHKPEKKTTGGGKGQPQRTEIIPAVPFPCRLVSLSVAIARVSQGSLQRCDLEAIKKMLNKPDSWGAKLSYRAKDLLFALSVTRSKKGPFEQTLAEDFFKDLPNKGDIALIEHLAEKFGPRVGLDYTMSDEDFTAAVAFIDDWLGGELTLWNKLQRRCANFWRNRKSIGTGAKAAIFGVSFLTIAAIFAVVTLFVSSIAAIIYGSSVNLTPGHPFLGYADPTWPAAMLVFIGAWTATILLFLLKPVQGVLRPITKLFGAENLWLTSFGFKFTLLIAPFGFLLPLAILCGASYTAKFLIVGIPLLAIGSGMAFKAAEVPSMARLLTIRGAKYGWIGGLLIISVDWLVRNVPWMFVYGAIKSGWNMFTGNRILVSVILFALALVLGNLFIVRPIERVKYRSDDSLVVDKKTSRFTRLAVVLIALAVALMPWVKLQSSHDFDPIEVMKQWKAQKSAPNNTINPVAPQSVQTSSANNSSFHGHSGKVDCKSLSYEGRQAVGCK